MMNELSKSNGLVTALDYEIVVFDLPEGKAVDWFPKFNYPKKFLDHMAGRSFTLDMLYAPHPDPHVRQGMPSIAPWFGKTPTGQEIGPPTVTLKVPRTIVIFSIGP